MSRSRRRKGPAAVAAAPASPSRRWVWMGLAAMALLAAGTTLLWRKRPTPATSRPGLDVLLVTLDTTRADRLGCYGYAPGQDAPPRPSRRGGSALRDRQRRLPSRCPPTASILTGLYPFEHGVRNNGNFYLADRFETLATRPQGPGLPHGGLRQLLHPRPPLRPRPRLRGLRRPHGGRETAGRHASGGAPRGPHGAGAWRWIDERAKRARRRRSSPGSTSTTPTSPTSRRIPSATSSRRTPTTARSPSTMRWSRRCWTAAGQPGSSTGPSSS